MSDVIRFKLEDKVVLKHVFDCGQCFRFYAEGDGSYTGIYRNSLINVALHEQGNILEVKKVSGESLDEEALHRFFDLAVSYEHIKEKFKSEDEIMKKAISKGEGIRILRQDFFETLITFIISQNNNISRIRKNIESICAAYGSEVEAGSGIYAFPTAEELAGAKEKDLKALKLGYRAGYIVKSVEHYIKKKDRIQRCIEKLAKEYKKQEEENLFNELMKFPGVGAKVADCIMLFATPCKNRFPIDTWIKKIMEEKYAMKVESKKDKDKVQKFVEVKFSPYAGIAQQYLFYSAIGD